MVSNVGLAGGPSGLDRSKENAWDVSTQGFVILTPEDCDEEMAFDAWEDLFTFQEMQLKAAPELAWG
jgi:hypothetical protein